MKKILNAINGTILLMAGALVLTSCETYLDEMPDNRTEIDTPQKISQILVSAYAEALPVMMQELMSDNVSDYSKNIDVYSSTFQEAYLFVDSTNSSLDSPEFIWEANYKAIAAANMALEAIAERDNDPSLDPQRGEALICRAYAHFTLCNTFCQGYNPQSSTTDLGIPYIEKPETSVKVEYERGTVADVYEKIARDIEEGIDLIDDTSYSQPKYHFNKKAAYAFATQFYLYYGKYDKAAQYGMATLGDDPSVLFRNWDLFDGTSSDEYTNAYVSTDENANIFNQGFQSLGGRYYYGRYVLIYDLTNYLFRCAQLWNLVGAGEAAYELLFQSGNRSYIFPKMMEYFIYSDAVAGIGYPYLVQVVYSTEKTIVDRAEAYVMLKDYEAAARELSYFYAQAGGTRKVNATTLSNFYSPEGDGAGYITSDFTTSRFEVEEGMQTNLLNACLHARRIITAHEGTRLQDLKRYGVGYTHFCDGAANVEVEPYDKRLAIQLPQPVIAAGLEANPR